MSLSLRVYNVPLCLDSLNFKGWLKVHISQLWADQLLGNPPPSHKIQQLLLLIINSFSLTFIYASSTPNPKPNFTTRSQHRKLIPTSRAWEKTERSFLRLRSWSPSPFHSWHKVFSLENPRMHTGYHKQPQCPAQMLALPLQVLPWSLFI